MTEVIQFFLAVGVMILFAKMMGYAATRLSQPAVLGELIAGLLIGPTVLNMLGNAALFPNAATVQTTIIKVAEIGVLLLIFSAGLEVQPKSLLSVGRPALLGGVLGVVVPIAMIVPAMMGYHYSFEKALFVGILFASMSTAISAQVMFELGVLQKKEGLTLLGAALVDDAIVIFLLSLYLAINPGGVIADIDPRPIPEVFARMIGFVVLAFAVSWVLLPRAANVIAKMRISEGPLMFAIVSTLLLSWAAEYIGGIAAITGAFMAGICLRRSQRRVIEQIEKGIHSINYGFLVPLFFISIGLKSNLQLLTAELLPMALVITALAIISKLVGVMFGTRISGFDTRSSLRVGIGMISRGEVGLIIAAIGISEGILQPEMFAIVVFVVLLTTLVTPPLLRWSFIEKAEKPASEPQLRA
ncbi:MAG: cation:proton antiporter [Chloroflexi bacterium]|nr:cation:proton antiporter [Chloroflexota bacterium]